MELFYFTGAFLLAAAVIAVWIFRRPSQLSVFDRFTAALIPLSGASLLVEIAAEVSRGPFWLWNDVRLARGVALGYGYKMYYDGHGGPIIGTMHAPLGFAVYIWIGLLRNPTLALLAGCTLSALFIFGPMAWVLLRANPTRPSSWKWRILLFLGCSLMAFFSAGLTYSAFRIHADAAALGFAAMAAAFLYFGDRERTWRDLGLSAACAVLSVWSKQTLVPLLVALPAFVWMCEGTRQLCRYLTCLAVAGAAISALMLAAFGPLQPMWFNMFVVPMREPHLPEKNVLQKFWQLGTENLLPAAIILFLLLLPAFISDGGSRPDRGRFLAEHRWLVFGFVGIAMFPTFVAGILKVGGDINHLSLVSLFMLLAAGTGLGAHLGELEAARPEILRGAARTFTIIFVLIGMLRTPIAMFSVAGSRPLRTNSSESAYRFEKAHPGEAYFPFNPLAVLLASGKLYHSDIGLKDRELSGYGIGGEQFRRYAPRDYRMIAIPTGAPRLTAILTQELEGSVRTRGTGDLAGWAVYRFPSDTSDKEKGK
jgi:hypothetical protein